MFSREWHRIFKLDELKNKQKLLLENWILKIENQSIAAIKKRKFLISFLK